MIFHNKLVFNQCFCKDMNAICKVLNIGQTVLRIIGLFICIYIIFLLQKLGYLENKFMYSNMNTAEDDIFLSFMYLFELIMFDLTA